jgi:hypothetical protein
MAGHLFFVPDKGFHRTGMLMVGKPVHSISLEHTINTSWRYFYPMIAYQIPGNSKLAQIICGPQVNNQIFYFQWYPDLGILWTGLVVDKSFFAFPFIISFPLVIGFPGNAKIPTGLGDIFMLFAIG